MIIKQTIEELAATLSRAQDQATWRDPVINIISPGHYQVQGRLKPWYDVWTGYTEQGQPFIACGCLAGLNKRACHHALRAMEEYLKIKKGRINDYYKN